MRRWFPRMRPASGWPWVFQLFALFACAGEIAHSQQATLAKPISGSEAPPPREALSELSAPDARGAADDDDVAISQPSDEPAADLAVNESEAASAASDASAGAPAPEAPALPLYVQPWIEEPAGGPAMAAFHAALRRAAAGQGQARVLFYGASHVASDLFTGRVREILQRRFGDAGAGFVMPAKPWRFYRHAELEHLEQRGWSAPRVRARAPMSGRFGLAGVSLEAGERYAFTKLRTRATSHSDGYASRFELLYLRQPEGGHLRVLLDGNPLTTLSTDAHDPTPAYYRFEAPEGAHEIELRTFADGPVTVFGMTAEKQAPGVVLDTVGIPGARVRYQLLWDDAIYREHVAHRAPDLFVLAYGTNEAGDKDVPIEDYERELRDVVGRLRATAPQASCLLIGPSDRPEKLGEGEYGPRERTGQIVEAQRRTARELGCGFFDLVAFMGGPMSMVRWSAAVPAFGAPDHVHFTRRGYEALGDVLAEAILRGIEDESAPADAVAHTMR